MRKPHLTPIVWLLLLLPMVSISQTLKSYSSFKSAYVAPRQIDIWLPRSYFTEPNRRYDVLYMHDGQNIFDPATAYGHQSWRVDSIITALADQGIVDQVIVVGVWNTPSRYLEYCPQRPIETLIASDSTIQQYYRSLGVEGTSLLADRYLRMIVSELKPYIDTTYRTRPEASHTAIAGSSMGGMISMYAFCEYPHVFGKAACLSIHWPLAHDNKNPAIAQSVRDYMIHHLPSPTQDRFIYFDHGTTTLDALYSIHQVKVDSIMVQKQYVEGLHWQTMVFEGAQHNESAWRNRFYLPLGYLFSQK